LGLEALYFASSNQSMGKKEKKGTEKRDRQETEKK
jgi:hypothetical protein